MCLFLITNSSNYRWWYLYLRQLFSHENSFTKWKIFFNLHFLFFKPKPRWISKLLRKFWNFDTLLDNINGAFRICSVATNDFNANTSRWWKNDITNSAGLEHDSSLSLCHSLSLSLPVSLSLSLSLSLTSSALTSSAWYTQLIDEPIHKVNKFNTNQNVNSKQLLNQVFTQVRHALPNYYQ